MKRAALIIAALAVSACDPLTGLRVSPFPKPRPEVVESTPVPPSPASVALAAYFADVEQGQITRGLLRSDGGGPDVPFDARRVSDTFAVLAFQQEFRTIGSAVVRQSSASALRRWQGGVRVQTVFGPSVPDDVRARDEESVERYVARLSRVTDHPINTVSDGGNFHVLFVNEDERRVVGPLLERLVPEIQQTEVDVIEALARETYCVVLTSDPNNDGVITRAFAVIRAELPPMLRLSCIHEEIAQGLGLANDSPDARPSIFNDDDEFGRLTTMDEVMLGLLYDPALRPGMTEAEAMPTVRMLAAERLGGDV